MTGRENIAARSSRRWNFFIIFFFIDLMVAWLWQCVLLFSFRTCVGACPLSVESRTTLSVPRTWAQNYIVGWKDANFSTLFSEISLLI